MSEALIIGATGLIGRAVIAAFGDKTVTIVARRSVDGLAPHHAERVASPENWPDIIAAEQSAGAWCLTHRGIGGDPEAAESHR